MEYASAAGMWLGPAPWDRVTYDWLTSMPHGIHFSSRYVARPRPLGQGDPRLAHLNASWNTLQQQVRGSAPPPGTGWPTIGSPQCFMEYTPAAGTWLGPAPWDRVTHDWLTLMPHGIHSSSRHVARPRPLGQGDPRLAHLNASWNTLQQQARG